MDDCIEIILKGSDRNGRYYKVSFHGAGLDCVIVYDSQTKRFYDWCYLETIGIEMIEDFKNRFKLFDTYRSNNNCFVGVRSDAVTTSFKRNIEMANELLDKKCINMERLIADSML